MRPEIHGRTDPKLKAPTPTAGVSMSPAVMERRYEWTRLCEVIFGWTDQCAEAPREAA